MNIRAYRGSEVGTSIFYFFFTRVTLVVSLYMGPKQRLQTHRHPLAAVQDVQLLLDLSQSLLKPSPRLYILQDPLGWLLAPVALPARLRATALMHNRHERFSRGAIKLISHVDVLQRSARAALNSLWAVTQRDFFSLPFFLL